MKSDSLHTEHLSPALAKMTALETLNLNDNKITDKGCEHLSPALAKMTNLVCLGLGKNQITDQGCEHLAPALAKMTNLIQLNLLVNQITDQGKTQMREAWKQAGKSGYRAGYGYLAGKSGCFLGGTRNSFISAEGEVSTIDI